MRVLSIWCLPLCAALCMPIFASGAGAGEGISIPTSLAGVADGVFRDALSQYAPDYDSRPRDRQVLAYVNIFKALNNGAEPVLDAGEAGLLASGREGAYGSSARSYADDPEYFDPYAPGGWFYDDGPSFGVYGPAAGPLADDYWGVHGPPDSFFYPGPGRAPDSGGFRAGGTNRSGAGVGVFRRR